MPKSPVSYLTDEAFNALPLQERALHEARSQVGREEVPRGSNWGPWVRTYLAAVGLFKPAYWCAAFVSWCLIVAGCPKKLLPGNAASTLEWINWAAGHRRLSTTPQRGCLFVYNKAGAGHIGFVLEVLANGQFRTIEGNTNPGGGRDGFGVFERVRSISQLKTYERWGFIRVEGLAA